MRRRILFGFLLCAICCGAAQAESLEEKLAKPTNYVPKADAPVDRLVEVAQRFNIPMGVEWVERAETRAPDEAPTARDSERSVSELIEEIASGSPELRVEIEGGLVRVYSPAAAAHPFNFLNLRLRSYYVNDGDLFTAEDQLRWAIRFTLEPEKYMNGYGGGYGHGAGDVFEFPKITLSCSDLTIRDALSRIALAQGNALWVATIKSTDLDGREPYWKRKGADGGDAPVTSRWRFLPLADIPELAKEQVAIDVLIEGLLDKRMTTIPVMLEHGLTANSGGASGGASSEGASYNYSAGVEKVGEEFVTLSVSLTVRRQGEAEFKFEEKLQVTRGRLTELQPEPRIRIRVYLEPRNESPDSPVCMCAPTL